MKIKYLFGILFASLAISTTSCGIVSIDLNVPLPEYTDVNSINIINKEEISTPWTLDNSIRRLKIETDPISNVPALVAKNKITIESSAPSVVSVDNFTLTALQPGNATVTVNFGTLSDSVDLTVIEKTVKYNTIADFLNDHFDPHTNLWDTSKIDLIEMNVAVSAVNDQEIIVTDGVNHILTIGDDGLIPNIGDNYKLVGKPTTYYGIPQISNRSLTKLPTNNIQVPAYGTADYNALVNLKETKDFLNESALLPSKDRCFSPLGLSITGTFKGMNLLSVENIDIRLYSDIVAPNTPLDPGDTITIHGILTTFNTKYNCFRFISTSPANLVKKGPGITDIYFDEALLPTQCMVPFSAITSIKILPEGATAQFMTVYSDPDQILEIVGNTFIATKPGTITLTPHINYNQPNEYVGKTTTITFSGIGSNIITNRIKKTIPELNAMDPSVSVKNEIYEIEGSVKDVVNSVYGNITIQDAEGNTLETYGLSHSFASIALDNNGNIISYTNPKTFLTHLYGHKFDINDTIKIALYSDTYNGKKSYKAIFIEKTQNQIVIPCKLIIDATNATTSLDDIVATKTWNSGETQEITITPSQGYEIDQVLINRGTVEKISSNTYRITFLNAEHTLTITTKLSGNYTAVGSYDLTSIHGGYQTVEGLYFTDGNDLLNHLHNDVTTNPVSFVNASFSSLGVEKANLDQGPKVGGIKLNNKNADRVVTLSLNLAVGQTMDRIVLTFRSWNATSASDFSLTVNDKLYEMKAAEGDIKITFDATDINSINLVCNKGRVVFTKIELFNKL